MTAEADTLFPRITDYIDHYARITPAAEAVVFEQQRYNYAELKNLVDHCARALLALGVQKGDRVAVLCTSRPEFWISFHAVVGIGGIWVGLNPKYQFEELAYVVGDSQPMVLFCQAQFEGRDYQATLTSLVQDNACVRHVVAIGGDLDKASPWADFLDGSKTDVQSYQIAAGAVATMDPALIVYTSGTTGKPKGAVLSHYGLCFGATLQNQHYLLDHPSLVCNFPINHVACVADSCCTILIKGGKIVFQERFDPGAMLAAIVQEKCTIWGGVPTMVQLQLAHPEFDTFDLCSVEVVSWGGAAMPREAIRRLQAKGIRLMSMYGMTETSTHVTYTQFDASEDELAESIGRPDPECSCRVVDEKSQLCQVGETGELQFKGDLMMLEYWQRPEATRETFTADGWLKTGDTAFWREDENLQIVGRTSEMFKSGGYNVYPREIELVLDAHPAVALCAVIGVADDLYQEVGHAYVMTRDDAVSEQELKDFCRERLANYKVPKRLFIRQDLPLLPVGKVDKKQLKAQSTRSE